MLQALRGDLYGLALQPDQNDGLTIFKTPFPRANRGDFPPGRGYLVADGRVTLLQVAEPDGSPAIGENSP